MRDVQKIPTGQLVQEYREHLLALGRETADTPVFNGNIPGSREADLLEAEILRRMAW